MKAQLSRSEGRLVRAIVFYLSKVGKDSVMTSDTASPRLVSIESTPWSSLTFAGERHRLIVRLPRHGAGPVVTGNDIAIPGFIVAVERAVWTMAGGAAVLTLDVLVLAAP